MRLFFVLLILFLAAPVWCEDSNAIFIYATYVSPNGRNDIFQQNRRLTTFDVDDLNDFGATAGYDYLLGGYVNLGGSVTYYKEDAGGRDRGFTFPNGGQVAREFRLWMIPVEFNARVFPLGRDFVISPYIGGGVGMYFYEYEEEGFFVVDRNTNPRIVSGRASSSGRPFGFQIHGGIQVPISGATTFTVEVKQQYVEDDLDRSPFFDPSFEPIDLTSILYSAGFSFGF